MQIELNPERVQLREKADEVLQAAAEPIDRPGHHDIEPAARSVAMQLVESRPAVAALGPADAVIGINLNDLMPHAGRGLGELAFLSFGRLVVRANSQI